MTKKERRAALSDWNKAIRDGRAVKFRVVKGLGQMAYKSFLTVADAERFVAACAADGLDAHIISPAYAQVDRIDE